MDQDARRRFAGAMLRVVLALKREPDADLEEVMQRVMSETGVDEDDFRRFLTCHAEVMTRVSGRGSA